MAEKDPQGFALESYAAAISYYRAGHFAKAQKKVREYQHMVDYGVFRTVDNRIEDPGCATLIIVTRDRGDDLRACLDSLKHQQEARFEIIVVDNGGNHSLREVLVNEKILLVECPAPFTPSEARNIGTFHSRADLLVFLDDDGLAEPGFVKSAFKAFEEHPFLGIRGRILPKSPDADQSLAGLYNLGDYPLPALLDIEGNIAVPKSLYNSVNGMNPLLFGAEGLDLTARLLEANPQGEVYYWPNMVIRHDYASGERLIVKRERQALVNEYFRVMCPGVLKIKERYTKLCRTCRKQPPGHPLKRLSAKISTVGRDMGLALKGEKSLPSPLPSQVIDHGCNSASSSLEINGLSEKETTALLQYLHRLEKELETTRKSLTFRIGHLIKEAWASPLRQGILLPIRLGHLVKEYLARTEQVDPTTGSGRSLNDRELRNREVYSQPGRQEHRFTHFAEFLPHRERTNSSLRIAGILSPWMLRCLSHEAHVIDIKMDHWLQSLEAKRPDFVMVQSIIEKTAAWPESCVSPEGPHAQLASLIQFCHGQNIPIIFWDTEDHVHFPLFAPIAPLFDYIFVADPTNVDNYRKLLKRETVHLGPAVQPVLHNPLRSETDDHNGFSILMDGWADMLEHPAESEFLQPLLKEGLHIVESRYRLMANKLDDLPAFRDNIMGCLSYGHRLEALRHYRVIIMPAKTLSTPLSRSWQAIEAIACGCSVVMREGGESGIPDGLVFLTDSDLSTKKKALELLKDEIKRLKHQHLARRRLFSEHTYAHRIRTICETLGIRHDWDPYPMVSVILPTKRPELIDACLAKFHQQRYPNKELIVVVNTDAVDMTSVHDRSSQFPEVRVIQLHQEKNIGVCLNVGVAQAGGKYWFKMDDDDFYGPNYLLDMVQLAETTDFHIIGKPPAFIFLESEGQVYLRGKAHRSQFSIGATHTSHLCGATLGGRKDLFSGFSEDHRACVDTGFVENGKAMNQTLLTGDFWNFVAFRAADKGRHTWRHDDEGIVKNAAPFCKGLQLEQIMI